jgi:hypothetical protein
MQAHLYHWFSDQFNQASSSLRQGETQTRSFYRVQALLYAPASASKQVLCLTSKSSDWNQSALVLQSIYPSKPFLEGERQTETLINLDSHCHAGYVVPVLLRLDPSNLPRGRHPHIAPHPPRAPRHGPVWLAIDKFKKAAVLAREQDTEAEGTALSRLGHVYKKVLKMEGTAHHYYFKAVELALTFPPGRVNKMVWAKEAIAAVGEHQEKVEREEEAKKKQEKEPYLEMMRDELAALQVRGSVVSSQA